MELFLCLETRLLRSKSGCGTVNETQESAKHFLVRVNGGASSLAMSLKSAVRLRFLVVLRLDQRIQQNESYGLGSRIKSENDNPGAW